MMQLSRISVGTINWPCDLQLSARLTLLIPSYFGPTLYTKGGGGGGEGGHPDLKFCKVLEIPFKVSENTRVVENLLYGMVTMATV